MKKVIFYHVIIFVIVHSQLSGQSMRIKSTGVETCISYNYLEDLKLHFLFTVIKKQHAPFIGLEFPVNSSHISNFGIDIGYKFYPNRNQPKFDVFFLYLMQANSRKLYSTSVTNGFSLHNLIGYGFNIYFNDKIYLKHHIAAGIEKSWFEDYGNFTDLSIIVSFGVGLKIKTIKPKE
ncbi:MAG: hypothetical protein K8S16_11385 [Bacteroidales bacterium]|nr:hypothetical protein [Bacteroidales bacterium]